MVLHKALFTPRKMYIMKKKVLDQFLASLFCILPRSKIKTLPRQFLKFRPKINSEVKFGKSYIFPKRYEKTKQIM